MHADDLVAAASMKGSSRRSCDAVGVSAHWRTRLNEGQLPEELRRTQTAVYELEAFAPQ